MPKASVIIPTRNRAWLLNKAIQSVLEQTFQDFEIVVIDDASQDTTRETVTAPKDKRIKYILHDKKKGEAGARNTGYINVGLYPPTWDFTYDYHWQIHTFYVLEGKDPSKNITGFLSISPTWSVMTSN